MLTAITIGLASLAILLIAAGLFFAKNRKRHVPLMLAAFIADMIGLVLVEVVIPIVEGRTDPVSGLTQVDDTFAIRIIHAIFATLSLVGYGVQIFTGRKLMRGDMSALQRHRTVARYFVITRLLAYITMFLL